MDVDVDVAVAIGNDSEVIGIVVEGIKIMRFSLKEANDIAVASQRYSLVIRISSR